MLSVIVKITAKPQKAEEVKKRLSALVVPTRKEEGCIQYDLHQSLEDQNIFFFYEIWESKNHLDLHLNGKHFKEFSKYIEGLLIGDLKAHLLIKI